MQGVEQGARFEVGSRPISMGRGVFNEIRLHDTEVSRVHASIQLTDDIFSLTDRNSSNGTMVNGKAVTLHRLIDGDDQTNVAFMNAGC